MKIFGKSPKNGTLSVLFTYIYIFYFDIFVSLHAWVSPILEFLYYYMRNFCNLIGLAQWYFSLIWNIYTSKLQTLCG